MASNDTRTDIHFDLGTGTSYGSAQVFDPSDNFVVAVALNASAISDLNGTRGQFAFGGALTSLRGQEFEYIFGGSDSASLRQLVLTVASPLLISEFRLSGPQGGADEFIELYNNDIAPLTVSTTDGSPGWALVSSDGVTRFVIPNGTMIPVTRSLPNHQQLTGRLQSRRLWRTECRVLEMATSPAISLPISGSRYFRAQIRLTTRLPIASTQLVSVVWSTQTFGRVLA